MTRFANLLVVAVLVLLATDEEHGGEAKAPGLYVKDGDQFRPATDEEVEKTTAAGHGGEKGGLDFTGIKRYDLGIYTLIVFGLLLFVLSRYAWPHISEG